MSTTFSAEDAARAIESNVPGAVHMANFWIGREVLSRDPETLGPPTLLGWEIEGVEPPSYEQVLTWVEALPPLPPSIPQSCTPAQGGIALIRMGFMPAVESVIDGMRQDPATYAEILWAWDRATVWERSSPSLNALADAAGITQTQMDELFELAATIIA